MRRLVMKMSITIDGYVGGPNGEIDWIMRTLGPEATAWIGQTLREAGTHIMGRRTYADMVEYWPTSADPLAAPMNETPKVAFSRSGSLALEPTTALRDATEARRGSGPDNTPAAPGWEDTRVLGADLSADVALLKAESGKDLLAHGGASFARSLVELGLVDEYRLLVHPVVLGSGLALFEGVDAFDLDLVDSTSFAEGIQGLVYRPR
jgi:dihydrofolate reductase